MNIKNQQCEYLGVRNEGCLCQCRVIVIMFNGCIEDYNIISKIPTVKHKFQNETYDDECDFVNENVSMLDWYDKKIKELEDGIYELIVESGCWADYDYFYGAYEGDGTATFKVVRKLSEEEGMKYFKQSGC